MFGGRYFQEQVAERTVVAELSGLCEDDYVVVRREEDKKMLRLRESDEDERRGVDSDQGRGGLLDNFEEAGEYGDGRCDEGTGPECELGDNEVSLEMFSQELDAISLSRGMVENIWYVELESGGQVLWSSVIACDLFRQGGVLDGGGEDRVWEGLGSGVVWDKRELFGGDVNVITRGQLCDLLSRDGITDKTSTSLFVSVGLWKSLFLSLNYSTYIRRRRELLYSKQARRYILRFNKRRETVERRMGVAPDEHERGELIRQIYSGIRDLFSSVSVSTPIGDVCGDISRGHAVHRGGEVFKATYKLPFYWASLVANIYVFEKLGQYDLMLAVMEYVSETSPEVIFDLKKHSRSYFYECVGQDGGRYQGLVESLCVLNNELLQGTSACFQEYLSDLLSVTEKSRSILSSYLASPAESQTRKDDVGIKCQAKACPQDARREPNYMRPTRLSEMRRQSSRRSIEEKAHSRQEDEDGFRESRVASDQTSAGVLGRGRAEGVSRKGLVGPVSGSLGKSRTGLAKEGLASPDSRRDDGASETREAEPGRNPAGERDRADGRQVGVQPGQESNLSVILSILEEKSKSQSASKVGFDDELFNIISEIDQIHLTNDVSTNISDDFPHDTGGDSVARSGHAEDADFADSPSSRKEGDLGVSEASRENGGGDAHLEIASAKSPLDDPYDWYYLSGNNENGVSRNVQAEGSSKSRVVYVGNDKAATLISLDESRTLSGGDGDSGASVIQIKQETSSHVQVNDLKYIESILDKEIEELQKQEDELASSIYL